MHIGYNKYIGYFLCTTLFCTLTHTIVHCELHPFCHPLVHHEGLLTLGQCPSIAVAGDSTLQHFSKHRVTQFNTMQPSLTLCITKQHSGTTHQTIWGHTAQSMTVQHSPTVTLCNTMQNYATLQNTIRYYATIQNTMQQDAICSLLTASSWSVILYSLSLVWNPQ